MHDELGQPAEALEALKDAIQGQCLLVNAFPNVRNYLGNLAGSECNVGATLAKQGKHDEAGPLLAQALEHIHQTLALDATHRGFRNYRRMIGREFGNLHLAMRQHGKAADSIRRLVAEQPTNIRG
ncbi:MAG: tetratricopeptide (TPR) repeat protein [Planctomycetota bacterium]